MKKVTLCTLVDMKSGKRRTMPAGALVNFTEKEVAEYAEFLRDPIPASKTGANDDALILNAGVVLDEPVSPQVRLGKMRPGAPRKAARRLVEMQVQTANGTAKVLVADSEEEITDALAGLDGEEEIADGQDVSEEEIAASLDKMNEDTQDSDDEV